ncbi:hypothetical protein DFH07DRAFT_964522 [Mycena maculata]|uniref:SAP domain-containing protein n=1 Tax=Mycena maculata TaxID=230809 RepID=A0AAD7N368_9AGAR|nr:hypothetical protein DFH07DRAFT_964522 [Mycena maculata]
MFYGYIQVIRQKPTATGEIFTAADYAPSISTSTQLHLPIGFPTAPSGSPPSPPSMSPSSISSVIDVEQPPSDLSGPALVQYYKELALKLAAERDEANAHATLAASHIQSLQIQLNSKGTKRSGNERILSTTARMLTSAEGRILAQEKQTTQLQKKAKDDENRTQRLLADAEVIKWRAELGREGMQFTGSIKSLKAPQLKDLAWSLELNEVGTREMLIERILGHFGEEQNSQLKLDTRYADLWREGRRRRAAGGPASSINDPEQPAPMEGVLVDRENIASGSGSSTLQPYMPPPPSPPNAPYTFSDSWTPPPHAMYEHPIDHLPPFAPRFYAPSEMRYPHDYPRFEY